ncbi:MAG: hypothetical protein ACKVVT_03615 [Dehalococcoidia bacterium]
MAEHTIDDKAKGQPDKAKAETVQAARDKVADAAGAQGMVNEGARQRPDGGARIVAGGDTAAAAARDKAGDEPKPAPRL